MTRSQKRKANEALLAVKEYNVAVDKVRAALLKARDAGLIVTSGPGGFYPGLGKTFVPRRMCCTIGATVSIGEVE